MYYYDIPTRHKKPKNFLKNLPGRKGVKVARLRPNVESPSHPAQNAVAGLWRGLVSLEHG